MDYISKRTFYQPTHILEIYNASDHAIKRYIAIDDVGKIIKEAFHYEEVFYFLDDNVVSKCTRRFYINDQ